ncbi:MAG: MBL fold metallo-hydrolase [Clostridia bacterium]|nr:MBL fold metallo-hydrolase [Clostridia bacterium]
MGEKCRFYYDIQSLQDDVTGSGNVLTVSYPDATKEMIVVDFGLYQGSDEQRKHNEVVGFKPERLCGILLTHAHIDHCGRIPLLYKNGAYCRTYMTKDTMKIAEKLLKNTATIIASDEKPMYSMFDLEACTKEFRACEYGDKIEITSHIHAKFIKNSHIAGAACIRVEISYPGEKDIVLVFSGDYNETNDFSNYRTELPSEILDEPISALILESTYGSRKKDDSEIGKFEREVVDYIKHGKDIIVPAFAFGRFQNILKVFHDLQESGDLDKSIPIYIDGGLGVDITFLWQYLETVDVKNFMPDNVTVVEDRKLVMISKEQKIIITTSGMCNFGPAREYIPYYISREDAVIFLTGYSSEESTARKILEAQMGDVIPVLGVMREKKAIVTMTGQFSSHARKEQLIEFVKRYKKIGLLLIEHGNEESKLALARACEGLSNVTDVAIVDGKTDFRGNCYGFIKSFRI